MIYRGEPCSFPPDTVETPRSIQARLEYLAALLILDEACIRFGPEKAEVA